MINILGQVMVYVYNQDEAVKFWTEKVGFTVISEEDNGEGMRWIEVAPQKDSETTIVLHNKEVIEKMNSGINLGTPSLLFFTKDIEKLYKKLTNNNVTVGEIMDMPTGKTFNFADSEENYFAVIEKNKIK
ncbi:MULTISPECIES: VOC family protein [Clostridium]|uniref:VOC family protein n=2 Tax=Clostridiaceae TaxID=31979 RepID=UPI000667E6D2|nr:MULTISPECIES: VOC family protein [Clostridium]MBS7132603.1 VOC family protein [Clostridium sp.]MDB2116800.1 VOC family protein [Clostridium paraputrificum]MDB2120019.1 VOC family protein [Clostridium paraputrificum]MDC0801847.1 VOC family protein [Clostridium paraputrificum]MDU2284303.1 VOC family protein [Clostridium sp.]